jgi:putative transposase
MGLRFRTQEFGTCFFVTTSFFRHQRFGEIAGVYSALASSLVFSCRKYGAALVGYVFMPSHIHLVLCIDGGKLKDFMRDFKKFTAQKALRDCGIRSDKVWQDRYDRQVITTEDILRTKLRYIHGNPWRAGLVDRATAWYWSSAADYSTEHKGPLPVMKDWT